MLQVVGMPSVKEYVERAEPVKPDAELHEFLNLLQERGAVPVQADNDVIGMVFIDDVSRREYPITSKALAMIARVPRVDADTDVAEAAVAIINGRQRAVPVFSEGKYVGVLTERGLMRAVAAKPRGKKVEEIMNEPVTIASGDNAGKARSLMRDRVVGKLPVVDEHGELVGIVDWSSFVVLEKPKESLGLRDRRGDYLQGFKMPVTTVMDANPLTVERGLDVSDVAKRMHERNCSYAIVVDGKKPVGIVTCEDILELLAAKTPREGVYVQITGADELDTFETDKLHSNVDEAVRKIARIYSGIEYFFLHVKKYETQGEQTKYSMRTRLMTPVGTFHSRAHGYDLAAVTDEAMDRLERIVKEDHTKRKQQARERTERAHKER